jgi:hypothetical protein
MGGKTTAEMGQAAQQGGFGGAADNSEETKNTRREQGYGPGSGVGA